jgi:urease accessory protein
MVENSALSVENLGVFLQDYLAETGTMEAWYCRRAHSFAVQYVAQEWLGLNRELSALKPARESRQASATLGRRLLALSAELSGHGVLRQALNDVKEAEVDIHYVTAFGLAGSVIGISEQDTVLALLWQCVFILVSAAQRLLPLGQAAASRLLWDLQPAMAVAAQSSRDLEVFCFTPLIEIESMRHPNLPIRLFIS